MKLHVYVLVHRIGETLQLFVQFLLQIVVDWLVRFGIIEQDQDIRVASESEIPPRKTAKNYDCFDVFAEFLA